MIDKAKPVLVVEDILAARETVINLLRVLGFKRFEEAANGEEALETLRSVPGVSLIVSDWNMPRMNGLLLLQEIRRTPQWSDIPFLMLTSKSEGEDVALASDMGVTGYLVKPLTIRALAKWIEGRLGESPDVEFERILKEVRMLVSEDRVGEAEALLRDFGSRQPSLAQRAMFELARILVRVGRLPDAEVLIRNILAANPMHTKAWEICAGIQIRDGRLAEAEESTRRALELSPNNPDHHILMGRIHLMAGDSLQAKASFVRAMNVNSRDHKVKQDIWNAYLDQGMVEEVYAEFGPFIMKFLTAETLGNMGVAWRKAGRLGEAIEAYQMALEKEPNNAGVLYNMAMAQLGQHNVKLATNYLRRALAARAIFPEAVQALERLGIKREEQ